MTTQTFVFLRVFANIFAVTKYFAKKLLPVYLGPRWSFLFYFKKFCKSRDTVPLNSWILPLIKNVSLKNELFFRGKAKNFFKPLFFTLHAFSPSALLLMYIITV